jgi:predicted NAD/FAD-binding protein
VELTNGHRQTFDEVILATHADTSLQLLAGPDDIERETLESFPYQDNHVCLHTDTRVLPNRKPAWASWNYRIPANDLDPVSVSYNMNRLQALDVTTTYCVSLNQIRNIAPEKIIQRMTYRHPVFGGCRDTAQSNHQHLIRKNRISYCGAYWGHGFHEDGIRSGLTVAKAFDTEPPF